MNLGILAHVDAGNPSLTERLLYDEPVHRFRLEFPDDTVAAVLRGLAEVRAVRRVGR